jgi:hypothetical protein
LRLELANGPAFTVEQSGVRIDIEDGAGAEVENQQVAEYRVEGKAERMRARSLDVDLPDDIAARADDDQHGVAGESAVGVEANVVT